MHTLRPTASRAPTSHARENRHSLDGSGNSPLSAVDLHKVGTFPGCRDIAAAPRPLRPLSLLDSSRLYRGREAAYNALQPSWGPL